MVFRKWYKDMAKYCGKRDPWWGAESLFKSVRAYPNKITTGEYEQFATKATTDYAEWNTSSGLTNVDFTMWFMADRDKELYDALDMSLGKFCGEVINGVEQNRGF